MVDDAAENPRAVPGDNSKKKTTFAIDRLRGLVERIERLESERKDLGSDIRDIYLEARSAGFDTKVLRELIKIRRKDPAEVDEEQALLDVYKNGLGM